MFHFLIGEWTYFSTHDLSWRSTVSVPASYTTLLFQLTTSRGGRPSILFIIHTAYIFFNSRPLVEVDSVFDNDRFFLHFSTHDLSWRSTAKFHNKSLKFCIFSGHFILEQMSLPFSYKYH